jgi:hypothetical protein
MKKLAQQLWCVHGVLTDKFSGGEEAEYGSRAILVPRDEQVEVSIANQE